MAIALIYFLFGGHSGNSSHQEEPNTQNMVIEENEPDKKIKPHVEETEEKDGADRSKSTKPYSQVSIDSPPPSPSIEACEKEENFFSRNNCLWRECEKPEYSALPECEHRGKNKNQNEKESIGINVKPTANEK